jgi:hypothetical protein
VSRVPRDGTVPCLKKSNHFAVLKHSVSLFRQLMVKGILSGAVMQTVSKEMFTGRSGREMVNKSLAQVDRNPPLPVEDRKALRDLLRGVKELNEQRDREGASRQGGLLVAFSSFLACGGRCSWIDMK